MNTTILLYLRWRQLLAGSLLVTLNAIHPFIHQFEGGSLDAVIAWLALEACTS